jgi:hypothetical protein
MASPPSLSFLALAVCKSYLHGSTHSCARPAECALGFNWILETAPLIIIVFNRKLRENKKLPLAIPFFPLLRTGWPKRIRASSLRRSCCSRDTLASFLCPAVSCCCPALLQAHGRALRQRPEAGPVPSWAATCHGGCVCLWQEMEEPPP